MNNEKSRYEEFLKNREEFFEETGTYRNFDQIFYCGERIERLSSAVWEGVITENEFNVLSRLARSLYLNSKKVLNPYNNKLEMTKTIWI